MIALFIFISAAIAYFMYVFRYNRELEDEVARGNLPNNSRLKLREGEKKWQGYYAKWAYPLQPYVKKWYHFGIKPKNKERFAYSITLFVFLTDTEHWLQFKQTASMVATIVLSATLQLVASYISYIPFWLSPVIVLFATIAGLSVAQIRKEINNKIS